MVCADIVKKLIDISERAEFDYFALNLLGLSDTEPLFYRGSVMDYPRVKSDVSLMER